MKAVFIALQKNTPEELFSISVGEHWEAPHLDFFLFSSTLLLDDITIKVEGTLKWHPIISGMETNWVYACQASKKLI